MLKDWIVHRMDDIATCKELLCDNPRTYEFRQNPVPWMASNTVEDKIFWKCLEDNVMDGK